MTRQNRSEAELMTLIAQGDEQAFEDLYDRYKDIIFGLALHIVDDHTVAEDVLIDVFSQIWRHAGAFDAGRASVKTWITRVARNRAIDELRRQRIRSIPKVPEWAAFQSADSEDPNHVAAHLELKEMQLQVRAAIASLPTDQQEALSLAYFKGYSHRMISEILNRPLGTVKTQIRSAMQHLRAVLNRKI